MTQGWLSGWMVTQATDVVQLSSIVLLCVWQLGQEHWALLCSSETGGALIWDLFPFWSQRADPRITQMAQNHGYFCFLQGKDNHLKKKKKRLRMEGKTPSVKWIEIIYCYFLNVVYIKPTGALGRILQRYCRQKKKTKTYLRNRCSS